MKKVTKEELKRLMELEKKGVIHIRFIGRIMGEFYVDYIEKEEVPSRKLSSYLYEVIAIETQKV